MFLVTIKINQKMLVFPQKLLPSFKSSFIPESDASSGPLTPRYLEAIAKETLLLQTLFQSARTKTTRPRFAFSCTGELDPASNCASAECGSNSRPALSLSVRA